MSGLRGRRRRAPPSLNIRLDLEEEHSSSGEPEEEHWSSGSAGPSPNYIPPPGPLQRQMGAVYFPENNNTDPIGSREEVVSKVDTISLQVQ